MLPEMRLALSLSYAQIGWMTGGRNWIFCRVDAGCAAMGRFAPEDGCRCGFGLAFNALLGLVAALVSQGFAVSEASQVFAFS
ncbi:MAG: hypothetical protein ORN28_04620, partial [Rhodoferax sp.]|nr:hypothetical protein [Rhodoferax sp.]